MVGMGVRKEEVAKGERDPVAHHLALGSLPAVDEQGLALPNDSEGADATFDGRARCGGAKKTHEERHRGEYRRRAPQNGPAFALTSLCKAGTMSGPWSGLPVTGKRPE